MNAQAHTTIDPTLILLAGAMRVQFADEPAAQRAVDRAVAHLSAQLPYEFDGVELRVVSFSRQRAGIWHVTDGTACTCEGARHPWCRHRAMFRLLLAQAALQAPNVLRAKILEQCEPEYTDSILDEAPRVRQIDPVAGSTFERLTAELDDYFTV